MDGRKKIISMAMVLMLSAGMAFNANATTIDEAQQKANELEEQKKAAEAEKNSLSDQLNTITAQMTETKEKLDTKEAEIQKAEDDLTAAKLDEHEQYESMKKRIKYMYENGNTHLIEVLLDSKDISDFLNKAEYVTQISEYDRNMLVQFQELRKSIEEQEAQLQSEYAELESLQNELVGKQQEVQTVLEAKNTQIADLESQIGENAANLQKLLDDAAAAEERQKQAAAAAAAASSGSGSYTAAGPSVVSGNGEFTHPCPSGYITSYFGEYRSPSDPAHKGMDFGTGGQAVPTYAAADGYVVIAGWSNSAGNWVVIDHGNGIVTKYMHHSALCVSAGQSVSKGQQIGLTGTTGNSSGVHLHFQVEVNGTAVDPRNYL
ncbi:MAG: peptidoglycan DD-metalloendopeptidase family protein [Hespellia sp.]|nr:peptidoglycan DD-metalloendopeptidase family protein [Hespellia sp.]